MLNRDIIAFALSSISSTLSGNYIHTSVRNAKAAILASVLFLSSSVALSIAKSIQSSKIPELNIYHRLIKCKKFIFLFLTNTSSDEEFD